MFDIFRISAMRSQLNALQLVVEEQARLISSLESDIAAFEDLLDSKVDTAVDNAILNVDFADRVEEAIQCAVDNASFTVRF